MVPAVSQPSATETEVNSVNLPAQNSSPKKPVAVPSEATLIVDGQKCVLRVDNTGRLMACPITSGMSLTKLSFAFACKCA